MGLDQYAYKRKVEWEDDYKTRLGNIEDSKKNKRSKPSNISDK